MPSITQHDLLLRYGLVNAMYPLSGMLFAPLFGWLETAGTRGTDGKKLRKKGIVRKIGYAPTFAFFVGNILYASVSYISSNEEVRFSIIVISRLISGIASGEYVTLQSDINLI